MSNEKKHILVVEDNLTAAKAAQFIFELLGCTVQHADDGDKAVKLGCVDISHRQPQECATHSHYRHIIAF